jgi:regulator of protease activity HflC (stomatin/prohibitin superfamily)
VLSSVDAFNLRNQQKTEDLAAIAADGAPLAVRASTIGYHLAREELSALDREVGPDYYAQVLDPIVRSTVRRVLAQYSSFEIGSDVIKHAQNEITAIAARRARPFHIIVDMVDLRSLAVVLSRKSYTVVVDTSVIQQEVDAEPDRTAIARQRASQRRIEARGIAAANEAVIGTLTPEVLADRSVRAWGALLDTSSVVIVPDNSSTVVEEAP